MMLLKLYKNNTHRRVERCARLLLHPRRRLPRASAIVQLQDGLRDPQVRQIRAVRSQPLDLLHKRTPVFVLQNIRQDLSQGEQCKLW